MGFRKAERRQSKLKLAITGPSGSGKTFSALRLAKGLGGKIAVIDTENGSASLYSDRFDFDVMELEPPYTNEKYLNALNTAVSQKYDIVIIDSLTHQWAGEGGLLNKKEQMDARGGNSYTNWAKMTPEHEKFKSAILHSDIHVIGTMRSKMDYVMETNDKGKQAPKKVGLAPIQRDGMEYEFTTVFDVAMNHEAEASKDRTGLFVGKIFQIDEQTGVTFSKWLEGGKPNASSTVSISSNSTHGSVSQIPPKATPQGSSSVAGVTQTPRGDSEDKKTPSSTTGSVLGEAERKHVIKLAEANKWPLADVKEIMMQYFRVDKIEMLTPPQYQELVAMISIQTPKEAKTAFASEISP